MPKAGIKMTINASIVHWLNMHVQLLRFVSHTSSFINQGILSKVTTEY